MKRLRTVRRLGPIIAVWRKLHGGAGRPKSNGPESGLGAVKNQDSVVQGACSG